MATKTFLHGKPIDDAVEVHEHISPQMTYVKVLGALFVMAIPKPKPAPPEVKFVELMRPKPTETKLTTSAAASKYFCILVLLKEVQA